jgi:hypothetical protein
VDLEGGPLYWGMRKMRFLRDIQNALQAGLSFHRGTVGEPGGVRLPRRLREKKGISGFLSWTRRPLRFKPGGHLELW